MGSTNEWFGLDIRFTVNIPETTTWELMLLADDGAVLSIDDENVIDNDGIHAPTPVATTVKLEKGLRNFRVRYFQGPGPDLALMLAYKKPGAADYGYVPRSLIGRPPPACCRRSSRRSDRRRRLAACPSRQAHGKLDTDCATGRAFAESEIKDARPPSRSNRMAALWQF